MTLALRATLLSCALVLPAIALSQQTDASLPAYDVVSIHENRSGSTNARLRNDADGIDAENVTLMTLLMSAYGLRADQISGVPSWGTSTRFNVQGKVVEPDRKIMENLTVQQRRTMLLAVLNVRFGLKARVVTSEMPVYELLVAKGGPKVQPLPATPGVPEPKGSYALGPGLVDIHSQHLALLAQTLANNLQRNVIDKTGLNGMYTFRITWVADPAAQNTDGAPSIFVAIQEQLGLRLQPSRAPVETLVVDHVNLPSSNDN